MRATPFALSALLILAGCGETKPAGLEVRDPWVRLAAVSGSPAAAYFTLKGGLTPDRLIAVESDRVATVELHEGGMSSGMATMASIQGADIAPSGVVPFAPGGHHAMLFGVDPGVRPGGTLPLRFRFKSGIVITENARAVAAGDDAPEHAGH